MTELILAHNIATNKDLHYGITREDEIYKILMLKHTSVIKLDKFNKYDFLADGIFYEVKSRRNTSQEYKTTIIGTNKRPTKKLAVVFIFFFTDKIMFVKYDEELFKTFKITKKYLYDRHTITENYEIPINLLLPIENIHTSI